jgi:hypothetical protein
MLFLKYYKKFYVIMYNIYFITYNNIVKSSILKGVVYEIRNSKVFIFKGSKSSKK